MEVVGKAGTSMDTCSKLSASETKLSVKRTKKKGENCGESEKVVQEQDRMPIANLIRIMRKVLPPHAKISDEAKEIVQECVTEFISFVTSEANGHCMTEQRKTITPKDILSAMKKLGFKEYSEPLELFLSRYRKFEGDGRPLSREPAVKRTAPGIPPMSAVGYPPTFPMQGSQAQGMFPPTPPGMNGYSFMDGNPNPGLMASLEEFLASKQFGGNSSMN